MTNHTATPPPQKVPSSADRPLAEYPRRERFFAHRFCRLLGKACAAQQIGSAGAYLCVTIAMVEDAKRYSGPVTFHTGQLLPILGFTKWDQLERVRARAVEHSWLHYYHPGQGSRAPGIYWVTIPDGLDGLSDSIIDESIPEIGERIDTRNQGTNGNRYPESGEVAGKSRVESGEPSYLSLTQEESAAAPSPSSKKSTKKKFAAPTVDDVRAYCLERGNRIDPETFVDFYTANGWVQSKGKPIIDWRAAVRTWEKREANGERRGSGQSAPAKLPTMEELEGSYSA